MSKRFTVSQGWIKGGSDVRRVMGIHLRRDRGAGSLSGGTITLASQGKQGDSPAEVSGTLVSRVELAKLIGSSQSRVAKIEAADPSVSLDLLVGR